MYDIVMRTKTIREDLLQSEERRRNLFLIVAYCMRHQGCSKREICEGTALSWGLVSQAVNDLVARGFLNEQEKEKHSGSGRTSLGYLPSEDRFASFGISVERDHFYLVAVSLRKNVFFSIDKKVDTSSKERVFAALFAIIDEAKECLEKEGKELLSIGLSVQSYVDSDKSIIVRFPGLSTLEWQNVDVLTPLKERYGVSNFLERDGVCLLFEYSVKVGRDTRVLLLLDNRLSFGFMNKTEILSGLAMHDLGHTVYGLDNAKERRTLSGIASIKGITANCHIGADELFAHPDKYADTLHEVGRYIGLALYDVCCLYATKHIVLAGRLLLLRDYFLNDVYQTMSDLFGTDVHNIITFSFTDSQNGAVGASLLGMHEGLKDSLAERY